MDGSADTNSELPSDTQKPQAGSAFHDETPQHNSGKPSNDKSLDQRSLNDKGNNQTPQTLALPSDLQCDSVLDESCALGSDGLNYPHNAEEAAGDARLVGNLLIGAVKHPDKVVEAAATAWAMGVAASQAEIGALGIAGIGVAYSAAKILPPEDRKAVTQGLGTVKQDLVAARNRALNRFDALDNALETVYRGHASTQAEYQTAQDIVQNFGTSTALTIASSFGVSKGLKFGASIGTAGVSATGDASFFDTDTPKLAYETPVRVPAISQTLPALRTDKRLPVLTITSDNPTLGGAGSTPNNPEQSAASDQQSHPPNHSANSGSTEASHTVEVPGATTHEVHETEFPKPSSTIYGFGFPYGRDNLNVTAFGKVLRIGSFSDIQTNLGEGDPTTLNSEATIILGSSQIDPAMSGGPVFDSKGDLIGLNLLGSNLHGSGIIPSSSLAKLLHTLDDVITSGPHE